jgi:hypothetical protein
VTSTLSTNGGEVKNVSFKVLSGLASLPVHYAVMYTAFFGALVGFVGCGYEAYMRNELLMSGGPAALDAYLNAPVNVQDSLLAFMFASVSGQVPAFNAVWIGVCAWIMFALAPVVGLAILGARLMVARSFFLVRAEG